MQARRLSLANRGRRLLGYIQRRTVFGSRLVILAADQSQWPSVSNASGWLAAGKADTGSTLTSASFARHWQYSELRIVYCFTRGEDNGSLPDRGGIEPWFFLVLSGLTLVLVLAIMHVYFLLYLVANTSHLRVFDSVHAVIELQ
jgi:hypothetical protein